MNKLSLFMFSYLLFVFSTKSLFCWDFTTIDELANSVIIKTTISKYGSTAVEYPHEEELQNIFQSIANDFFNLGNYNKVLNHEKLLSGLKEVIRKVHDGGFSLDQKNHIFSRYISLFLNVSKNFKVTDSFVANIDLSIILHLSELTAKQSFAVKDFYLNYGFVYEELIKQLEKFNKYENHYIKKKGLSGTECEYLLDKVVSKMGMELYPINYAEKAIKVSANVDCVYDGSFFVGDTLLNQILRNEKEDIKWIKILLENGASIDIFTLIISKYDTKIHDLIKKHYFAKKQKITNKVIRYLLDNVAFVKGDYKIIRMNFGQDDIENLSAIINNNPKVLNERFDCFMVPRKMLFFTHKTFLSVREILFLLNFFFVQTDSNYVKCLEKFINMENLAEGLLGERSLVGSLIRRLRGLF